MNKLYFIATILLFTTLNFKSQTCMGKHNNNFTLLASEAGVDFYYRINHCQAGDEILLQVTNNNAVNVNISFTEKVFSANQVSQLSAPINLSVNALSTLSATACAIDSSPLQIVGVQIFTNEIPMQLMKLELSNIVIQ